MDFLVILGCETFQERIVPKSLDVNQDREDCERGRQRGVSL